VNSLSTGCLPAQSRRAWMRAGGATLLATHSVSWLGRLAAAMEGKQSRPRACLLLWMNGGPSQTDTFDLKPGHANGGPFQPISTSVPGITVGEHLPEIAKWMDSLAVIRSMSTREGDHGRARDNLRTGYFPQGAIQFPVLGSLVSKERGPQTGELPNYVSVLPQGLFRGGIPPAGFLGAEHAPLRVGGRGSNGTEANLRIENLEPADGVSAEQFSERVALLEKFEQPFLSSHSGAAVDSHLSAYSRGLKLMEPRSIEAIDLEREPANVRDLYGRSQFGQGCLLARRMLERGVPFVEVTLGGWDTHVNNFPAVRDLCTTLDRAWAALLGDLRDRGLLENTVVVWMGEFGRTPTINPQQGRDHYPRAWSVVLGGAGIRGGSVIGRTSDDGLSVEDRPVSTPDLLATIFTALEIDPARQNLSNVGRPIRLVDPSAAVVTEALA
jgi:uncharacterized protein (DUF1501 family)